MAKTVSSVLVFLQIWILAQGSVPSSENKLSCDYVFLLNRTGIAHSGECRIESNTECSMKPQKINLTVTYSPPEFYSNVSFSDTIQDLQTDYILRHPNNTCWKISVNLNPDIAVDTSDVIGAPIGIKVSYIQRFQEKSFELALLDSSNSQIKNMCQRLNSSTPILDIINSQAVVRMFNIDNMDLEVVLLSNADPFDCSHDLLLSTCTNQCNRTVETWRNASNGSSLTFDLPRNSSLQYHCARVEMFENHRCVVRTKTVKLPPKVENESVSDHVDVELNHHKTIAIFVGGVLGLAACVLLCLFSVHCILRRVETPGESVSEISTTEASPFVMNSSAHILLLYQPEEGSPLKEAMFAFGDFLREEVEVEVIDPQREPHKNKLLTMGVDSWLRAQVKKKHLTVVLVSTPNARRSLEVDFPVTDTLGGVFAFAFKAIRSLVMFGNLDRRQIRQTSFDARPLLEVSDVFYILPDQLQNLLTEMPGSISLNSLKERAAEKANNLRNSLLKCRCTIF